MASAATIDALTRINLDDFFDSLGWAGLRRGRGLLERVMWLPARRFAEQVATYDALVAERGLPDGAAWILKRYLRELLVAGREHLPASGPALVLANHPGMADTAALFVALGRPDVRIVALERPFLKTLTHTSRQLIYVSPDPAQRMPVARAVVAELRAGRAVLTFPAGEIEPDPAVQPGAAESLDRWSDSVSLFARLVPETVIVPAIVSGVLHPAPQRHPLLRLRRTQKDKEKMAAMLQILWRGYQGVTVRVAVGQPLPARELLASGEPHRAAVAATRRLIEHPPTGWQPVVRGLR
jgi:1-acyl-sn-glycerol-3-phosphate acyltransferase